MQKETLKEYTRRFCDGCSNTQWDNSPATECGQCLEDFVEAIIRLCTPKPSADLTVPMENPSKECLMWNSSWGIWYKCFFDMEGGLWVDGGLFEGPWEPVYTHWLPMPPAPL